MDSQVLSVSTSGEPTTSPETCSRACPSSWWKQLVLFLNYISSISVCAHCLLPIHWASLRRVRLHLLHILSAAGVQAETFLAAHQISLQVSLLLPNPIPAHSKSVSILPSGQLTLLPPLKCFPLMLKVFQEYPVHHASATFASFSAWWVGLELGVGDLWKSKLTDRTRCTLKTRLKRISVKCSWDSQKNKKETTIKEERTDYNWNFRC